MFHVKHLAERESFVRGIMLSSVFNGISKCLLFAISLVLANYFGARDQTDIFFYLYNTLWLLITVFASLHVGVVIPEAMHRRAQNGEKEAIHFLTFFFYLFGGVSLMLMGLLFIHPVWLVSIVSKYDIEVLLKYRFMIISLAPLFPLILITQYLIDLLHAYRYFTLPVLTGLFNNVLSLLCIVLFYQKLELYAMVLALYVGYFLNFGYLIFTMKRHFSWDFTLKKVHLKSNFKMNFWVGFLGNIWNFVGKYDPNYFLSASGTGLLSAFNYGQKIANIPTDAITNQTSSVSAIRLNELVAEKNREKLNLVFSQICDMLIFILVPIAVLFYTYGHEIVSFCYLRGQFTIEDVAHTAYFVRYLGFLLPLFAINTIVSRLYNAGQIIKFSTIYSVVANILLVFFLWITFSHWGIWAIPFALLLQNLINVFAPLLFIRLFFKEIRYYRVLLHLFTFTIGCLALALSIRWVLSGIVWPEIVKAALGCFLFIIAYMSLNEIFKFNIDVSKYLHVWIKRLK